MRLDARDAGRKKTGKKGSVSFTINQSSSNGKPSFITINHAAVPIDDNGHLTGRVGEKIENGSTKEPSGGSKSGSTEKIVPGTRSTEELRKFVDDGFKSGRFSDKMDWDKQSKHKRGSKRFKEAEDRGEHPSWLLISDDEIEQIVKDNVHSGKVEEFVGDNGSISYRIPFQYKDIISRTKSMDGTKITPTDRGYIHLSYTGVHITPKYYAPQRRRA